MYLSCTGKNGTPKEPRALTLHSRNNISARPKASKLVELVVILPNKIIFTPQTVLALLSSCRYYWLISLGAHKQLFPTLTERAINVNESITKQALSERVYTHLVILLSISSSEFACFRMNFTIDVRVHFKVGEFLCPAFLCGQRNAGIKLK